MFSSGLVALYIVYGFRLPQTFALIKNLAKNLVKNLGARHYQQKVPVFRVLREELRGGFLDLFNYFFGWSSVNFFGRIFGNTMVRQCDKKGSNFTQDLEIQSK